MTALGDWGSTADCNALDAYLSPDQPDDDEWTDCLAEDPAGEHTARPCGVCRACLAAQDSE